jgi:hypothetical protein
MRKIGEVKYKITDNLYIYSSGKADFLVYLNLMSYDIGNIKIVPNKEILLRSIESGINREFILNMSNIENSVSKSMEKYVIALKKETYKELDIIALYLSLLKLKFYKEYIKETLLKKGLYDQYTKILSDTKFLQTIMEYLLDKRRSEQNLQKWRSILKDPNIFYNLYEIAKQAIYSKRKEQIVQNYHQFKEVLANVLKSYQNNNTQVNNSNPTS